MAHELDWRLPDRLKGFCLLTCPDFRVFGVSGFVCGLRLLLWGQPQGYGKA